MISFICTNASLLSTVSLCMNFQAELDEVEKCRVQSSHNQYTMKALTSDSDEETWKEEIVDHPNN